MDAHDDYGGLERDLPHLVAGGDRGGDVLARRRALRLLGGASVAGMAAVLAACSNDSSTSTAPSSTARSSSTNSPTSSTPGATSGTPIPAETEGPFPANGTNGPDVRGIDGVVRTDLRPSIGDLTGTADGVPLQLELTVVDAATGDPRPGWAVYLWHCTADGRYSIYEIPDQNYLRGIAATDDAGRLGVTTVFPGCYPGRWPHVHFEIYRSLADATGTARPARISQLAFPQADSERVYADPRYGPSARHLSRLSLSTDLVFADGWTEQLAVVSGSPSDSTLRASLLVRV